MKKDIKIINNSRKINEIITSYIKQLSIKNGGIKILEAGCGRYWPFDLQDTKFTLTGIDLDKDALEARKQKYNDLDDAIVGDLHNDSHLPASSYDIIYSSFVLEHIQNVEVVLNNYLKWLKPGGLIILTFPDRDSVFGFFTRTTPFWFHVIYKKYIIGQRNSGKPGFGPYPTYHDKIISRSSFQQFAHNNNLCIKEEIGFGKMTYFHSLFSKFVQALSMGKLDSRYVNLMYILEDKR